jgi:hypothetical protein
MTLRPQVAHIMPGHPRYDEFAEIFLDHEPAMTESIGVPIQAPVPDVANAPGIESGRFYRIDLERMRPDQVKKMAFFIQKRFGGRIERIEKEIRELGFVPLKDEMLCVAIDMRFVI